MNRNFKLISLTFYLTLLLLVAFFVANMRYLYRYERQRVADEVDMTVKQVSQSVLHENVTLLNHMAAMLTDKDFDQKMAFAAGFTQNMASLGVYFDDDNSTDASTSDTVLKLNKEYMRAHNINHDTRQVKEIDYFDSVLHAALQERHLPTAYVIRPYIRQDTAVPPDSMASRAFIIDALKPKIYRVLYATPHTLIRQRLIPNAAGACALILFVVSGFGFYRRSYKMQMQMARLKESLLGNVTHELKTPVSSLQLILDAAADNRHGDKVTMPAHHIDYARTELNRMKLNIDKILSFNKLNRKEFDAYKEPVVLGEVVEEAIAVMKIALDQSDGHIDYTVRDKTDILGDRTLLINVMTILIDNAIKYNTHTPRINITIDRVGASAIISVSDNGIGIPSWYHKKIFEPFFRMPTGNRHDVKGHGLGLSFANRVVVLHKGSITLRSEGKGRGSTFIINLPLA